MRTRRRFNGGSGPNRRRTTWARVEQTLVVPTDSDFTTIDLLANFKADGGVQQAVTVTRMHLNLTCITTSDPGDQFSWGVLRGQSTDVGLDIAGAPVPLTDPYEDWLFWELLTADTGGKFWPGNGNVFRYDIKAQRKLEELQMSLNLVLAAASTAEPFTLQLSGSILLMLP